MPTSGLRKVAVGYDRLMRIMEADRVEVESGDVLCFRTGFDRALLAQYADSSIAVDPHRCSGLDGFDDRLLQWIDDRGAVALVSDNEAVEIMPDFQRQTPHGIRVPLHNKCLFELGIPLGEFFLLSELADWLRSNGRNRFLFTAPPLRLPGAVGSPVTGVGDGLSGVRAQMAGWLLPGDIGHLFAMPAICPFSAQDKDRISLRK